MGDGMPYHLEKGPLLCIFEKYLNGDRATMEATLALVQASEQNDDLSWVLQTDMWNDPAFQNAPLTGQAMRDKLLHEWFGLDQDANGNWQRPATPPLPGRYWIGYRGDVATIFRRAVLWALELALGVGSETTATHPEPWPIEVFWKCPAPWFEAWVVSRKLPRANTGLVSLVLVSPSHKGADVAFSPIAKSPVASPANLSHPVPSWQDDYELLTFATGAGTPSSEPHPAATASPRPRVAARERDYATWVVTHRDHSIIGSTKDDPITELRRLLQEFTGFPTLLGEPERNLPQLTEWEGTGDIVLVAPSMAAGGIKHDGKI